MVLTGTGTADGTGKIPDMVALEPPYVGNSRFTIAVGNIAPGSR